MEPKENEAESGRPGKVSRIADQTRGLFEDLKTWVDLKIQLVELQVQEKVESAANQVAFGVAVAVLLLLVVIFGLLAGALALGDWFGSDPLGFLAVTGLLALCTLVLYLARPRFVRMGEDRHPKETPGDLPSGELRPRLPAPEATESEETTSRPKDADE